jgi:hypothetical protein
MFPQAGNPSGIPNAWASGVNLEFSVSWSAGGINAIGPHIVVTNGGSGPAFRCGVETTGAGVYSFTPSQVCAWDTWIPQRLEVLWSTGSNGYVRWDVNNQLVVQRSGATMFGTGIVNSCNMGLYGENVLRNEHTMAAMQYVVV